MHQARPRLISHVLSGIMAFRKVAVHARPSKLTLTNDFAAYKQKNIVYSQNTCTLEIKWSSR